jgi:hypothetical protein
VFYVYVCSSDAAYSPIAHGSPDVTGGAEEKKDSEAKQD